MTKKARSKIKCFSLTKIEDMVELLITVYNGTEEEVPAFNTRYPGILEAIIGQVDADYFGQELYPKLEDKAAIFFYLLIKNRPFANGNKRIAAFCLSKFLQEKLYAYKRYQFFGKTELYNLGIGTAISEAEDFNKELKKLKTKIRKAIRSYQNRYLQIILYIEDDI